MHNVFRRRIWVGVIALVGFLLTVSPAPANIELASLPEEGRSDITIYKPANLTFVQERREMTLTEGTNRLKFDWGETRIDPTSVKITFTERDGVQVKQLTYPAGSTESLTWSIQADRPGRTTVEISYFTLGFSWEALYQAELNGSETAMDLTGFVRVNNRSGQQFNDAKVRLLMGKINLLDNLASVIREWNRKHRGEPVKQARESEREDMMFQARRTMSAEATATKKDVSSEGVSEYHIMTIEGRERLRDGWSTRFQFFRQPEVPVENHYQFWPDRYDDVHRYLTFRNGTSASLGRQPLPAGRFQVYRIDSDRASTLLGTPELDYLPAGQQARLRLGTDPRVSVDRSVRDRGTSSYEFDDSGDVAGWNETETVVTTVNNNRSIPVTVEVNHQFDHGFWSIIDHSHDHEKVSYDRIQYMLYLEPDQQRRIESTVRFQHGVLRD